MSTTLCHGSEEFFNGPVKRDANFQFGTDKPANEILRWYFIFVPSWRFHFPAAVLLTMHQVARSGLSESMDGQLLLLRLHQALDQISELRHTSCTMIPGCSL